jgi:hypothetical protein
VRTTPDAEARLDDKPIEAALAAAHYVAAFVKETERPERIRLGGDAPESLTPSELLERYLASKSVSAQRTQTLLQYAQPFFEPPESSS